MRKANMLVLAVAVATVGSGCDFEVTNPGPVQDEFLNDPDAFSAVVGGMRRALSNALNFVSFQSAGVARELHPTGGTGSFGLNVPIYNGRLLAEEQNAPWNASQEARFVAEDGIRRFQQVLEDGAFNASPDVAEAYLWAGFSNRLLSENMCQAVIDGGPAQARSEYTSRAEQNFRRAIEVGQRANRAEVVTAARAGLASVLAWQNEWDEAVALAGQVPTSFAWQAQYYNTGDIDEANRIHHATKNQPYKTATVWGTVWELHFQNQADPRTPWADSGQPGDGGVDCCGPVPFLVQLKHDAWESDIELTSGRHMRLIEAEAALRDGDMGTAIGILNQLRADVGVAPIAQPASMAEAWSILKRERGAETWLEGRRLGDFFRWDRDGTPGALHPREVPGSASHMSTQDLCFPIAESEVNSNPNL